MKFRTLLGVLVFAVLGWGAASPRQETAANKEQQAKPATAEAKEAQAKEHVARGLSRIA